MIFLQSDILADRSSYVTGKSESVAGFSYSSPVRWNRFEAPPGSGSALTSRDGYCGALSHANHSVADSTSDGILSHCEANRK
jgi:hypothetical protein